MPPSAPPPAAILIVDDASDSLTGLADILEHHGHRVLVAQDGETALRRAQEALPDLILLDIGMPGPDGLETFRSMQQIPLLQSTPVIFMATPEEAARLDASVQDYLTKPLQENELLARVNMQLWLRATRHQLAERNRQLQEEVALRHNTESSLQTAYALLEQRCETLPAATSPASGQPPKEIETGARLEENRRRNEARMQRLLDTHLIGIFFWNDKGEVVDANDAFLKLVGHSREELHKGQIQWNSFASEDYQHIYERARDELFERGVFTPYEAEFVRKDGTRVPLLVGGAMLSGTGSDDGVAFTLDLSQRKRTDAQLCYRPNHDTLTGLPNHALLHDRLHQAIAHAQRSRTQLAVLLIDLDRFRQINDTHGHHVGDKLLQLLAERLRNTVRDGDSVARLGGDEFVLALPLIGDSIDATRVTGKTLDAIRAPYIVGADELHVSASIGISMYPQDGGDAETLVRAANMAMHYAKDKGRGSYQFFTQALNRSAQRHQTIRRLLQHGLEQHEFLLHYQPQVDLESGRIRAAEALLRWRPANRAMLSCQAFLAVAEETGMIVQLGEWALREACHQLSRWHAMGYRDMTMAVNLSSRQFRQNGFLPTVKRIVEETGVPRHCLGFEITEDLLLHRAEENVVVLKQLSGMGIRFSMDDFGGGYSGLSSLQRFPVNAVKIDRMLIRDIARNDRDAALAAAIIAMAHALQLDVLAEGVETPEQARILRECGCRTAQGFRYGEPVPAALFTQWLDRQDGNMLPA